MQDPGLVTQLIWPNGAVPANRIRPALSRPLFPPYLANSVYRPPSHPRSLIKSIAGMEVAARAAARAATRVEARGRRAVGTRSGWRPRRRTRDGAGSEVHSENGGSCVARPTKSTR
jgi:hypothetical protein